MGATRQRCGRCGAVSSGKSVIGHLAHAGKPRSKEPTRATAATSGGSASHSALCACSSAAVRATSSPRCGSCGGSRAAATWSRMSSARSRSPCCASQPAYARRGASSSGAARIWRTKSWTSGVRALLPFFVFGTRGFFATLLLLPGTARRMAAAHLRLRIAWAGRPSLAAGPVGKKSCHEKPFCRPRLRQRLVRRCYSSGSESRPLCFPSTLSSRDLIGPSWGRTPLGAARGLALHDVGHPPGQRRGDGPPARRHLVHHVGEGNAAIHVDNHQRAARAAPGGHPAFREQAVTEAPLDRHADHEVNPVELHLEDPVDRLRREEPEAIDLAAAGHGGLGGVTRTCIT